MRQIHFRRLERRALRGRRARAAARPAQREPAAGGARAHWQFCGAPWFGGTGGGGDVGGAAPYVCGRCPAALLPAGAAAAAGEGREEVAEPTGRGQRVVRYGVRRSRGFVPHYRSLEPVHCLGFPRFTRSCAVASSLRQAC